jgi:hypothetical protein
MLVILDSKSSFHHSKRPLLEPHHPFNQAVATKVLATHHKTTQCRRHGLMGRTASTEKNHRRKKLPAILKGLIANNSKQASKIA